LKTSKDIQWLFGGQKEKDSKALKKVPEQFSIDRLFDKLIFINKVEIGKGFFTTGKKVKKSGLELAFKEERIKNAAFLTNFGD